MNKKLILSLLALAGVPALMMAADDARLLRFPATNGNEIVFSYAGDLYKVPAKGGEAQRLTSHVGYEMFPRFSPDGKTIAFTGQYDGKNYEKTQVLELAGLVEKNLADYGVKVIMTRTTDENVDYTSRIKKINTGKAVATVSLHRDVAKKDGTGRGVSAWIYTSSPTDSKSLASDIMNVFKESGETVGGVNTGTPNDSSKNYYINQHSSSASCIIELGNMYNSDDNKLVTTNKEKTAKAISDGIIKYLEQAGYING